MTEEERRIITAFVERVAGVAPQAATASAGPWGARSVPSTQPAPNLPPVDPEADRLIGDLFSRYPEARYRITQTAFVQEAAMVQAQNRIQELEWQLENLRNQEQANQQQSRGGLFGGMFGGGNRQQVPYTPRPQPIQPPMGAMNPAMMQQSRGSGFLGTALTTAAGVAGGMVLGNALMGMFSGGAAHAATAASDAASGAAGAFGEQAVDTPAASPWTDPGGAQNDAAPVSDQGGWGGNDAAGYSNDAGGYNDAGGFDEEI
ncbi:DUF2076 domain-containing protein [Roseomonas chloroacetimidivorans]|uniref:DUF2076 domain-containing protein n=1 Tax=Roseomonas chloroacetimidivorans TaxID=1766656 RepID=UPI003C76B8C5